MAKVTAPILSGAASGQISKTQVYAHWRGVPYARRYVVPANPRSAAQTETRSVFGWASNVWKVMGAAWAAPWAAYAKGQKFTDRNAFIGRATKDLRGKNDLTDLVFSPGAGGGLPPTAITATGTAGAVTIVTTNPSGPSGWTISGLTGVAIAQADPATSTTYISNTGTAASPYGTVEVTGLSAGTYEVGAFLTWTKPDGSTAYSPSLSGTAVAT